MQDGTDLPDAAKMDQALADLASALQARYLGPLPRPEVAFPAAEQETGRALTPSVFRSPAARSAEEMQYVQGHAETLLGERDGWWSSGKPGLLEVVFQINYIVMRFPQFSEEQQKDALSLCKRLEKERKDFREILVVGPHGLRNFSDVLLEDPIDVAERAIWTLINNDPKRPDWNFIYLTAFYMNSKREKLEETSPAQVKEMVQAYDRILKFVGEHSGLKALGLLLFTGLTQLRILGDDAQVARMEPHVKRAIAENPVHVFHILADYALKGRFTDVRQETNLANYLEQTFQSIHPDPARQVSPEAVKELAILLFADTERRGPLVEMAAWYTETGRRHRSGGLPRVLAAMAERKKLG